MHQEDIGKVDFSFLLSKQDCRAACSGKSCGKKTGMLVLDGKRNTFSIPRQDECTYLFENIIRLFLYYLSMSIK